jgi:K+-transporting ATPase ATPase B chain
VLSDRIVVEITQKPGESFIDRMIALVEGARRQKTPNEIALNFPLASLTIIFLLATVTLGDLRQGEPTGHRQFGRAGQQWYHRHRHRLAARLSHPNHDRRVLSAIGIAGMDRLVQRNVLAMSGRAVEAAGDVNTLLLDKTGTITLGEPAGHRLPASRR